MISQLEEEGLCSSQMDTLRPSLAACLFISMAKVPELDQAD